MKKLLVANRGEIAVRIFRTCRRLGIATVAVTAPDDGVSLHARSADEVVAIESYLDPGEHVRAARAAGADAVHPGYGFLAESPAFAEAVETADLLFVGPSASALRLGGDKLAAKEIARRTGVPIVSVGDPDDIGFPLVVKAAAGGGGRGMRVVRLESELADALDAARREAEAAFGDPRVFCERYVERPKHVEVQLLGDAAGNVVALGERDCSIQRRHQKVLEESPSPAVDAHLRAAMSEAAVAFGEAIGYRSAGTAEFMVEGDEFWFLELNGRIQVEHPVTELVRGIDLVEQQLLIAAGEEPQSSGHEPHGHAIEARLYAEDPRTFLPQTGRITTLRLPTGIRVDAGVEEGDEIGLSYDPLIAKLVVHEKTRDEALDRLATALAETEVSGLTTNLTFLRWLVDQPERARRDGDDGIPRRPPAPVAPAGAQRPLRPGAARGGSTCRLQRRPRLPTSTRAPTRPEARTRRARSKPRCPAP